MLVCAKHAHHGLDAAEVTSWPRPFALHLLVSRSPYLDALRQGFLQIPDQTDVFESSPSLDARHTCSQMVPAFVKDDQKVIVQLGPYTMPPRKALCQEDTWMANPRRLGVQS